MTEDKIIATIALRLGNLRGQEAMIKSLMYEGIETMEREVFTPWFLLSENNHTTTIIGDRRLPVPKTFLKEYEDGCLYTKDAKSGLWRCLEKKPQDKLRPLMQEEGQPCYYTLTNSYFRLFPQPDDEYEMELLFYKYSYDIEGDENPWLINAASVVIYKTMSLMAQARKMDEATTYEQQYAQAYMSLQHRHIEREEINNEGVFGGD